MPRVVEENKDTRYQPGVSEFVEFCFSPSTAFAGEPPAWWTVVVMNLLDQRSPTLFLRRLAIDDDVDIHGVTSSPLIFPPLFVGIKFLFERRSGVRNRGLFRGPEK